MKNLAFQDIAGGSIRFYTAHKDKPRIERLKLALKELNRSALIKVYYGTPRNLKLITIKMWDQFSDKTYKFANNTN